ncbi:MAG TPA: cation:proton antiporter [Microthrixaceae bacterium]|nr:cation:proton antiporter [Microthrixaceae bacterium]
MSSSAALVIALLILAWAALSGLLGRHSVTGPLVFVVVGYLIANPDWGLVRLDIEVEALHVLAEITLALVLFSDASRINPAQLRHNLSLPVRLLGIGLPLSIALGGVIAALMFDSFPWALAGFIGAALAPTDAALSVQVIDDERVPTRLRQALNVESGLNDGIATPIVTFMLAVAASQLGLVTDSPSNEAGQAISELGLGVVAGLVLGIGGAALLNVAATRNWVGHGGRRIATLAIAVGAYEAALVIGGNGFIAAFVAGIAFGSALRADAAESEQTVELSELGGELLALVVWFVFGAALLPIALDFLNVEVVAYALLSLTVVRMLPVALCLIGSRLGRGDVVFIGWFGPRGLASVVFAILAIESLETSPLLDDAVGVVAMTIALSVILHGATAALGGRHYAGADQADSPVVEMSPARPTSFAHPARR